VLHVLHGTLARNCIQASAKRGKERERGSVLHAITLVTGIHERTSVTSEILARFISILLIKAIDTFKSEDRRNEFF